MERVWPDRRGEVVLHVDSERGRVTIRDGSKGFFAMSSERLLTDRFVQALVYAWELHADQVRKGGEVPYLGHLLSVASLVIEASGSETQVVAALLHDAAEDQGGEKTLAEIRERFGTDVAAIVAACSDTFEADKPPWHERKEAYLRHLAAESSEVQLVSLADKLDNARAILRDLRIHGPGLWTRFNVHDPQQHLWYYRSLHRIFLAAQRDRWLVGELGRTIEEIEVLVPDGDETAGGLGVLRDRSRLVRGLLTQTDDWIASSESEIQAESVFLRPGDPDDNWDYDYNISLKRVLQQSRETVSALEREHAVIEAEQQRRSRDS